MKLKHIAISNFRNIKKAEYDLSDRNIFIGPNYTGKTNTLLAIYWLLTGYLLDGSSDDASHKPNMSDEDRKQMVCVQLTFDDGWCIKKNYAENWVKKRGTKEIVLDGNITEYYIGFEPALDKAGVGEAKNELLKRMGYDKQLATSKFGLVRAAMDPYYMGAQCEWAVLRAFIIELVGDVSNDDVYATNQILLNVKDLLTQHNHDTAKVMKHLKGQINNSKELIDTKNKGIKGFEEIEDVDKEELFNAEAMIEQLDSNIANYNQQLLTMVNPNIQKLENDKASLQLELSKQVIDDQKHLELLNASTKAEIEKLESERNNQIENRRVLVSEKNTKEHEKKNHLAELAQLKRELITKTEELEKGRAQYSNIVSSTCEAILPLPKVSGCPHCGGLLNEEYIDDVKSQNAKIIEDFEKDKKEKLAKNIANGKALKMEVDDITYKIKDKEALEVNYYINNFDKQLEAIDQLIEIAAVSIHASKAKLVNAYESEITTKLKTDLEQLEVSIAQEKLVDTTSDVKAKIQGCKEQKAPYNELISNHNLYLSSQQKIVSLNGELDDLTTTLCNYENKLVLVEKFLQTKLSMLKGNVEKVFGTEVQFTLVETNIKEGSWNEVCYPSIKGKLTPFTKGSESEQIITGVYLIECIKQSMQLPDLPIIFDAGSELDTKSLKDRLDTKAQLIMTKVDDVNYKEVTLIKA